MKQFVSYLYEYREGKPFRNVGFVKVEQEQVQTVLHIHGKGFRLGEERTVHCSLFYMEESMPVSIWQSEIGNVDPAVNCRLSYDEQCVGDPGNYSRIAGVVLESRTGRKFIASWNSEPVNPEQMCSWKELQEKLHTENEENYPEKDVDSYIVPEKLQYRKIQRRELVMLPRCEWRLANNSFLMHGYYNYHHLLLVDDGDSLLLGVPGIYHEKEKSAAEAFGFSEFIRIGDNDIGAEEENPEDDFGYWCRRVRGSF